VLQAARTLNNIEDGFYISPAFLDKLSIHVAKNFLDLPKIKVPLILGEPPLYSAFPSSVKHIKVRSWLGSLLLHAYLSLLLSYYLEWCISLLIFSRILHLAIL